jgi:hypothetical protein
MRIVSIQLGVGIFVFAITTATACSIPRQGEVSVTKGYVLSDQQAIEPKHPAPMPLPRDPQIAVYEEFEAAKQANSKAAWELFLKRHADNTLAGAARQEIYNLKLSTNDG